MIFHKIFMLISTFLLKLKHPTITVHGYNGIKLSTDIRLRASGKLVLGKNVKTEKRVSISVVGGKVIVGDNTSINRNGIIVCHRSITIGSDVAIGPNVCIYDHDHVWDENGIIQGKYSCKDVIIGNHCWIGSNVVILAGTIIGDCSIIGAGTVIKGCIPDHSIIYDKRDQKIIKNQKKL